MNAVTQRKPSSIAQLPEPDPISPELGWALDQVIHPHPDIGAPRQFVAAVKAQAEVAEAQLRPFARPVTLSELRDWARPLGAGVRNPPAPEDFAAWCAALAVACGDFPAAAFSSRAQRAALQEFQFWPSVSDVCRLVRPKAAEIRDRLHGLRAIVTARTMEPVEPAPAGKPSLPEWVGNRDLKAPSGPTEGGDYAPSEARPPVRTVEEQLAALGHVR